jgi:hypothetical protein
MSLTTVSELHDLAHGMGIDPDDMAPVRYANPSRQSDRTEVAREIYRLIAESGEQLPPSAHEMRNQLRAVGIDLGHSTDDAQDRRSTAIHEAAHGAAAYALGWEVSSIDIAAGITRSQYPDIMSQDLRDRNLEFAVIQAAAAAASGFSSDWEEYGADRAAVRAKGWFDFETARKKAEKLLADPYVRKLHERLTAALIKHGRLEGAQLRAILDDGTD